MIEAVLLERLKRSDAALRVVVEDRIHPDFVPEDWQLPAVFYRRLKPKVSYNMDGSVDHQWVAFAFTCVASQFDKLQARQAADAIIKDLVGFSAVGEEETLHRVFAEDDGDDYDGEARRHLVKVVVEVLCTANVVV